MLMNYSTNPYIMATISILVAMLIFSLPLAITHHIAPTAAGILFLFINIINQDRS
jgi:hypothetical protein